MESRKLELLIIPFAQNAERYISQLLRLDALCFDEDEAWTEENFTLDFPQKGQLSKLAVSNKKLVGYVICTSYEGKGHIHRLAVDPEYRRSGIGEGLVRGFAKECLISKIHRVTVEALLENVAACKFYKYMGFRRLKVQELREYLIKKGKHEKIACYAGPSKNRAVYLAVVKQLCSIPGSKMEGTINQ